MPCPGSPDIKGDFQKVTLGHPTQRLTTPSAFSIEGGRPASAQSSLGGLAYGQMRRPMDLVCQAAGYFGPKPKLAMGRNAGALERNVESGWFFQTVVISEIAGTLSKTT